MPRGQRPGHETLTGYPGGINFMEVKGLREAGNNPHNVANGPFSLGDNCLVNDKHLLNLGYTQRQGTLGESPLFKMGPVGTIATVQPVLTEQQSFKFRSPQPSSLNISEIIVLEHSYKSANHMAKL